MVIEQRFHRQDESGSRGDEKPERAEGAAARSPSKRQPNRCKYGGHHEPRERRVPIEEVQQPVDVRASAPARAPQRRSVLTEDAVRDWPQLMTKRKRLSACNSDRSEHRPRDESSP